MMTERGVALDHSTIYRWVQRRLAITPFRSLVEGGSFFDADHPSRWVIFARRFTNKARSS